MTREEARQGLQGYSLYIADGTDLKEALNIAIEALRREEAEEKGYCHRINYIPKPCENDNCDCVEVVRCRDCRWYSVKGKTTMYGWCDANWISVNETDYCSRGERQCNYFGERREL